MLENIKDCNECERRYRLFDSSQAKPSGTFSTGAMVALIRSTNY